MTPADPPQRRRRNATELDRHRADPARAHARAGRRARDWIPAVVVFFVGIGLWEGLTTAFDVETFLLPKPSDIAQAFWDDKAVLWDYGVYTFKEAAGGFALGSSRASSRRSS